MKIPVVDSNDVQVGVKKRDEITENDIYRVSALWLTNSKGEILLAQRALTKKNSPGKGGPAVAGTVEDGETYDTNIVKEIREEIGLSLTIEELTKGPKLFIGIDRKKFFDQWYLYTIDLPIENFVIPKEEVAQVQWVNKEGLKKWYQERPEDFLSNAPDWLPQLLG